MLINLIINRTDDDVNDHEGDELAEDDTNDVLGRTDAALTAFDLPETIAEHVDAHIPALEKLHRKDGGWLQVAHTKAPPAQG